MFSLESTDYSFVKTDSNLEIVLSNDIVNNNGVPYYFNKTHNVSGNLTDNKKEIIYSLSPNLPAVNDRFSLYNNNTKEKILDIVVVSEEFTNESKTFLVGIFLTFVGLFLLLVKLAKKSKEYGDQYRRKIDPTGISATDDNRDFLIAKYGHFSNLFTENENLGEKRVSLFFTLLTSLTGAIGLSTIIGDSFSSGIFTVIKNEIFLFVISFLSLTLFFFGLVTLRRIIRRNVITDDYKVELDTINKIFGISKLGDIKLREEKITRSLLFGRGGYLETIKLLNSLILGLICSIVWIYLNQSINLFVFLPFLIGAGGGWANQSLYIKMSYHKEEKNKSKEKILKRMTSDLENEYSFIICSNDPTSIVDKIIKKTKIENFKLINKRELYINDVYLIFVIYFKRINSLSG